jgi:hypothetical protein
LNDTVYSKQQKVGDNIFFQYRFDENDYKNIEAGLLNGAEIVVKDIFWERSDGLYDKMISQLRNKRMNGFWRLLRIPFIHLYYGFTMFNDGVDSFYNSKSYGNMHMILRKK